MRFLFLAVWRSAHEVTLDVRAREKDMIVDSGAVSERESRLGHERSFINCAWERVGTCIHSYIKVPICLKWLHQEVQPLTRPTGNNPQHVIRDTPDQGSPSSELSFAQLLSGEPVTEEADEFGVVI